MIEFVLIFTEFWLNLLEKIHSRIEEEHVYKKVIKEQADKLNQYLTEIKKMLNEQYN